MSMHAPLSCGFPASFCSLPQRCLKTVVAARSRCGQTALVLYPTSADGVGTTGVSPVPQPKHGQDARGIRQSRVGWAVPTKILRTNTAVGIVHPTTHRRRRALTLIEVLVVIVGVEIEGRGPGADNWGYEGCTFFLGDLEDRRQISPGDWLTKNERGVIYSLSPAELEAGYDPVS